MLEEVRTGLETSESTKSGNGCLTENVSERQQSVAVRPMSSYSVPSKVINMKNI